MKFPFIRYTKVWLSIASATVVICLAMILGWGLKPGIDFTGGSLMEVSFSKDRPSVEAVQAIFEKLGQKDTIIQK
jgi:preprotein translocase subunit SecF